MLAALYNFSIDDADMRALFSVCNQDSHVQIIKAINASQGKNLEQFSLDPLDPDDLENWLEQHQQLHNDLNAALGTQNYNLNTIAFDSAGSVQLWVQLHVQEHLAAHQKLGLLT